MSNKHVHKESLIVSGFINQIQLSYHRRLDFPKELIDLCLAFYHIDHIGFVLTGSQLGFGNSLTQNFNHNTIQCFNLHSDFIVNLNIYDTLNLNTNNLATNNAYWDCYAVGIYHQNHLKIPQYLFNKYSNNIKELFGNLKYYNIIFKCGGKMVINNFISKKVSAILYSSNSLSSCLTKQNISNININALQIDLPQIPFDNEICQNCLYSSKYGLIIRKKSKLYSLDFNSDISSFYKWKWLEINQTESKLNIEADNAPFIMINDSELMVIDSNPYIYSFKTNNWIKIASPIYKMLCPGTLYVPHQNRVYCCNNHKVQYYDLCKLKWYGDIQDTVFPHTYFPMMFYDNQKLYIAGKGASTFYNEMEFYDFRNQKWQTIIRNLDFNTCDFQFERVF